MPGVIISLKRVHPGNAPMEPWLLHTTTVIAPKYATEKTVIWESSNPAIASVSTTGLVSAIAEGTATITAKTFDGSFQSSSAVTVINDVVNYQAEYAEYMGGVEVANQPGYFGSGFIDYTNASNDFIKWIVNVNAAGSYELSVRYALSTGNRPLKLSVNDEVRIPSITFPVTGSWSTWGLYKTSQLLNAGNNSITLTAIGGSGPNVDQIAITNTLGLNDSNRDIEKSVVVSPNPVRDSKLTISFDSQALVPTKGKVLPSVAGNSRALIANFATSMVSI